MIDRNTIYTYSDGRPIEGRPEPLPEKASTEEFIAWMRVVQRYSDRVTDVANRALDKEFTRNMRRSRGEQRR